MNGENVAVVEGGVVYYVRTDHIGRPVFATDDSGTKVWEASYLPFGGVHTSTGANSDLRFPGQWFQSEAGLHQNWMRDYDPTTGRYIQADPLGLVDGASVYGYVRQNPGRYFDLRGMQATDTAPGSSGIDFGDAIRDLPKVGGKFIGGILGGLLFPSPLGDGEAIDPQSPSTVIPDVDGKQCSVSEQQCTLDEGASYVIPELGQTMCVYNCDGGNRISEAFPGLGVQVCPKVITLPSI